jgi:hypothetical protein
VREQEKLQKELRQQIQQQLNAHKAQLQPKQETVVRPDFHQPVQGYDPRVAAYAAWMDPLLPAPATVTYEGRALDFKATEESIMAEAEKIEQMRKEKGQEKLQCVFAKNGYAFEECHPGYRKEDDVWERTLNLRQLDEAVRGDVSQAMPAPVVFAEDYDNYREGKYIKDDCWIA